MRPSTTTGGDILAVIRAAAADLHARSAELSATLAEQIAAEVPELAADPVLVEALATSVQENVREVTGRLVEGDLTPGGEAPAAALDYARRLAERGIPASALLRAYRIGQARAQEQVVDALAASGMDPGVVIAATGTLSTVAFAYVDGISDRVARAHEEARLRWQAGVARAQGELVAALLEDRVGRAQLLARELGHDLDRNHVAVVAWDDDAEPRLPRSPGSLVVPVDGRTSWAWLPAGSALDATGGWVAASEPASGPAGFVAAHREARRVQALVSTLPADERPRVTRAEQVRLPLLLAGDPGGTAAWVARTLGELAVDDSSHARLRETLRVFLDEGGSFSAAAARLGVHRNTVLYRLRSAERALGHSVREQRVEVEAALLAARWLGRRVLSRPEQR